MTITLRKTQVVASLALSFICAEVAVAAGPTAKDALSIFQPVQKDVDIERPTAEETEKCTIKAEGGRGWVVRDAGGQILRSFPDTNGDNVVDQWCYYKDGVEVYREIDSNFNRKADQFRWLNTGGSRWGVDRDEDKKIDYWKSISPEEATAELVSAMRDGDRERFERLLLNANELKSLGLGEEKAKALAKKIEMAPASFAKLATSQKIVGPTSKWVSFGGMQPGLVPAGTDGCTADLNVYENVMAMVETDGKAGPLAVGTLVRVGDTWRLIDLPSTSDQGTEPFFFPMPKPQMPDGAPIAGAGQPSEKMQKIMEDLQKLPDLASSTPADHAKRIELTKQMAVEDPENRTQWYHQIADMLSAAVQTGGYEDGITKLRELTDELSKNPDDEELAFYFEWRWMTAQHGNELAKGGDFPKIQERWIGDLTTFVDKSKKYPLSAEALMELGISHEFGGDEAKALEAYSALVQQFPNSSMYTKALGAKTRLESPGKAISLKGKALGSGGVFDLASRQGKAVLIQYWATWSDLSKADMPLLKELRNKYKDLEVVGVCLDNDPQAMMAFLKQNDPRWPQLFEEGGLENSRYAVELGIQIVPTMILIDKQGKVVNRNIRADELEAELQRILK
jgi:thiol-disulfide isomerase/thioredoxin